MGEGDQSLFRAPFERPLTAMGDSNRTSSYGDPIFPDNYLRTPPPSPPGSSLHNVLCPPITEHRTMNHHPGAGSDPGR